MHSLNNTMDLRFALRSIRRSPGFALLSVLILGLGIGANTAIFSVVNGVVLRPLGYAHPEQLVSLNASWRGGGHFGQVSGPDFLDWQAQSSAFKAMAVYADEVASMLANGKSEFTGGASVSEDFFKVFAIAPVAGRPFGRSDFSGKPTVALVSIAFWKRHFGNHTFEPGGVLNTFDQQFEIVGLVPNSFRFPESSQTEVWIPLFELLKSAGRSAQNYRAVGRLKPEATVAQAQAQLSGIANRLERNFPDDNKDKGVFVTSLSSFSVRRVKNSLYIILAAVALILLIACANIANLLLARGTGRRRELAIRSALGASRMRIVRQLSIESLLLAGLGTLAGVLFAYLLLPSLLAIAPDFVPRLDQVRMDSSVLAFCIAAGLLSSLLFGLAPALQAKNADPNRDLRAAGARGVVGGSPQWLRRLFVTVQVALCMTLLVAAGLLLRSFSALTRVNLGFSSSNILVGEVSLPARDKQSSLGQVFTPLASALTSYPNVRAVALTRGMPGAFHATVSYTTSRESSRVTATSPQAGISVVSGSFFDALQIPLLQGRTFSAHDSVSAPNAVIVNQALVRQSFPHENPLGQKILCGFDKVTMKWMTIVGVVADAHLDGPANQPMPEFFLPILQHPASTLNVLVKTRGKFLDAARPLREKLYALDPEATLKLTSFESHLASMIATPRFNSVLISTFAALAALLAALGIYGVVSYSVSQRTAELGLRLALGASPQRLLTMVLSEALKLTGAGLLIGLLGAFFAARLLASQLFEVSPLQPAIYISVLFALATVALAAALLPAWRAARIQPLEALREE